MRVFFDTEFHENGRWVDLISIGAVREDGAEFYAETDYSIDLASGRARSIPMASWHALDWLDEHVKPHLRGGAAVRDRSVLRRELLEFAGPRPEWWAAWGAYDWVALCQLYGRMVDLPTGWPFYVRDVIQLCDFTGFDYKTVQQDGAEHDALADAKWTRRVYDTIVSEMRQIGEDLQASADETRAAGKGGT